MQFFHDMPRVARFLLAGGLAALITWVVRFPLSLFMSFPFAVALATVIGMLFSFVTYRHFVFPGSKHALGNQLRDFILVNVVGMSVQTGVAVLFDSSLLPLLGIVDHSEPIAHAIAIAVGAVSNFHGHRYFSFRQPAIIPEKHTEKIS